MMAFERFLQFLRPAFFWLAVVAGIICALDWAVRTRRINPFGGLAQFLRKYVDPLIAPIERKIVRAGGMPHTAPWWMLVVVVVSGLIVIWFLEFLQGQIGAVASQASQGPSGVFVLLVYWTFGLLQIALLVRVLSSWFSVSPYSKWIRWSYVLTEWILRPLRQVIPLIGMIDITPIIAYFILSFTSGAIIGMLA